MLPAQKPNSRAHISLASIPSEILLLSPPLKNILAYNILENC